MGKIGVKEISKRTGFSPATVSKALNRRLGVSEKTVETILRAAEEMGYRRPEKIERVQFVLARKNGSIIDESAFHPAVIEGVEHATRTHGLPTSFVHLDVTRADAYRRQVSDLCRDTSSAIVLLGTELEEGDFEPFRDSPARLVVLDSWSDTHNFNAVVIANEPSVYSEVNYLISKGHSRIGYLAGSFRIQNFRYRERGYRRALGDAGLTYDPRSHVFLRTTLEGAYADMLEWLDSSPEMPTAFFADNDVIAVGALRALAERGYAVPRDVSIVGFDDLSIGSFSVPPLTTVHVHKHEIGEISVHVLLELLGSGLPGTLTCKLQVSTELVERGSVRAL